MCGTFSQVQTIDRALSKGSGMEKKSTPIIIQPGKLMKGIKFGMLPGEKAAVYFSALQIFLSRRFPMNAADNMVSGVSEHRHFHSWGSSSVQQA